MIKEYLETLSKMVIQKKDWAYKNTFDFLLKNGTEFEKVSGHTLDSTGEVKMCYKNSFEACRGTNLQYVEGLASSIIPVAHAWCVNKGCTDVIEPTWLNCAKSYFGVVIPFWYVHDCLLYRGAYGVIDFWEKGFPLISGKHEWPLDPKQVEKAGWTAY